MVEVVCEPIRKYVRNRPDSAEVIVRQVIAGSEEEVQIDTLRLVQNIAQFEFFWNFRP